MKKFYMKKRRRRGSTSPPLTGIEQNPGPRKQPNKRGRGYVKLADRNHAKARKKLSPELKGEIMMAIKLKIPSKQIAKILKLHPKTVRRWRRRFIETGAMKRRFGSGRPSELNQRT